MTLKELALSRFSDGGGEGVEDTVFIPDLTLWYEAHREQDDMPERWKDRTLLQIVAELGTVAWMVTQPWRIDYPGVNLSRAEGENERVISYETSSGILNERWTYIPVSGWWQVEYPVKSSRDFKAAIELVDSRTYVIEPDRYLAMEESVGDGGIAAIKIPTRPFAYILNDLVGWTQGLVMLRSEVSFVKEASDILERKHQQFLEQLISLPGTIFYSPDNLDAQFISPNIFTDYFAESYKRSTDLLHSSNRHMIVHTGGPIRSLLALMAESGIDAIQGISGPPQSDASLSKARRISGTGVTLWGGISQDHVMNMYVEDKFERTVREVVREAQGDKRMILGVADRVPVEADMSRIRRIAKLAGGKSFPSE